MEEGKNRLHLNEETQQFAVGQSSRTARRSGAQGGKSALLAGAHLWCPSGSWCTQPPLCGARWRSWSQQGTGRAGSPGLCLLSHLRSTHHCTSHSESPQCYPCSHKRLKQGGKWVFFLLQPTQKNSLHSPLLLLTRLRITGLAVPIAAARHAGAVGSQARGLSAVPGGAALTELPFIACRAGAALHPCRGHAGPWDSAGDGNVIQVAGTLEQGEEDMVTAALRAAAQVTARSLSCITLGSSS